MQPSCCNAGALWRPSWASCSITPLAIRRASCSITPCSSSRTFTTFVGWDIQEENEPRGAAAEVQSLGGLLTSASATAPYSGFTAELLQ
mmetsp:Transcript_11776/g.26479  ORF Transcript_11776/g.26479 Transcript_11776/m.26479 type:complete len:89 (+) Transcript_11776:1355-1621(+)